MISREVLSGFSQGLSGTLFVKVTFIGVADEVVGGSTLGGSLGGQNLAGSGDFKGASSGTTQIEYVIKYTPPVNLFPAPVFTLIPSTDDVFDIPSLPVPAAQVGTELPAIDEIFQIPTVGEPTGTVLPNTTSTFSIPTVTLSTNASSGLPNLPDTDLTDFGFTIPDLAALSLLPSAPGGEPDFSDSTFGFNIPAPTLDTAPSGSGDSGLVADVPEFSVFITLTDTPLIKGLTSDGTDFYFVTNDTATSSVDEIIKIDGTTGAIDTSFSASGTAGKLEGPSSNVEGLAFVDGSLWVLENQGRCFGDFIDTNRCDRNHRIFEIDPTLPPQRRRGLLGLGDKHH